MNKSKIVKLILSVLYFSISISYFKDYIDFKSAISESKSISYLFIDKKINKGGRGESYDMIIEYKNKRQIISITSKEFYLIENGKYPQLYYSNNSGLFFSRWNIKMALRITILFLLLSIIAIFPWNILNMQKILFLRKK